MKKYKLTTQFMTTHKGFQWKLGRKEIIEKEGNELCSGEVFHFYDSPELAILLNPIHANITNPRLFEVECEVVSHDGLKGGSKIMKIEKELPLPEISLTQKIAFGIYCAMTAHNEPIWSKWAKNWIDGTDRSTKAAKAAKAAANTNAAANAANAAKAAKAANTANAAFYAALAAFYAAKIKKMLKVAAKKAMKVV